MRKLKEWIFGEGKTCSLWYCFKQPDMYLQIGAAGYTVHIGYCERHAIIVDELCRSGQVSNVNPHNYTPYRTTQSNDGIRI